jgi:hypothetical protein
MGESALMAPKAEGRLTVWVSGNSRIPNVVTPITRSGRDEAAITWDWDGHRAPSPCPGSG